MRLIEKRFFLSGPPASSAKEIALKLGEHYQAQVVCVADLLRKEVVKKTQ